MGRIPNNMTEVLFISGHGTEYIQTDIYLDNECTVKSRWVFNNDAACIYGSFTSGRTDNFCLYGGSQSSTSYIRFNGQLVRAFEPVRGVTYSFEHGADGFFVDGTKIASFSAVTFTCSVPLRIFGLPNSMYGPISGSCYGFQILKKKPASELLPEETVVLYDFVPVKNEDTGEAGMYETVNGVFYGNSGTGAFTASTTIIERPIPGKISAFRRRLMEAACKHYEPEPGSGGYFWCYHNVTSTTEPTMLLANTSGITGPMIIDGVEEPLATSYQFTTTGEHLVKFKYNGGTLKNTFSNAGITSLTTVYLPTMPVIVSSNSNTDSPFYNTRSSVKVISRGTLNDMLYWNYTVPTSNSIEIEIHNLTSWTIAYATNCVKSVTVKGTYASIPTMALHGFNSTNNYRTIWIESPNLTEIKGDNFRYMDKIQTIVVNVATPPTLNGTNVWGSTNNTFKLYVPYSEDHSILNAYKTTSKWSNKASQIYELNPDGTIPV